MSDNTVVQESMEEMITRTEINNIKFIETEEKPESVANFIKEYFNITGEITIEDPYIIITGYKIPYKICDSIGSSPDWIIYMKQGKHIFCEDTKVEFDAAGNNAQAQRFTKFIVVLLDDKYHKIYYLVNKNGHEHIIKKNKVFMRLWKTCNIELKTDNVQLQDIFNNLQPYKDLSFIKDWNKFSQKRKGNKQRIIHDVENNCIIISGFKITKKNPKTKNIDKQISITNDPGIGSILLVICSCIAFGITNFIIDNKICDDENNEFCIQQRMINEKGEVAMKLINGILCIQDTFNVSIKINNIVLPDKLPCYNTFFNYESKSEKIVSIYEEKKLKEENKIIPFCNHARGSLEYIKIPGKQDICTPNEVYTPDLIWIDDDNETIYFVEAEKYENYNKKDSGLDQINSWKNGPKSVSTREFFNDIFKDTPYENYSHKAYITLYIKDINESTDIKDMKHVKYILDSKKNLKKNDNVEYLDLSNS